MHSRLSTSVLNQSDLVDQNHPDIIKLDEYVSWIREPKFPRFGRASWLQTEEIMVKYTNTRIKSIKLKGIGYVEPNGNVHQPTTTSYSRRNSHFGITSEGDFKPIYSKSAPLGGITLSYAKREFENAEMLFNTNCPAIIPIKLYIYQNPNLKFSYDNGNLEQLAVVATGLLDDSVFRMDSILRFNSAYEDEKHYLNRLIDSLGISTLNNPHIVLLDKVAFLSGQTIRKFSESGFYRYSGTLGNLCYDFQNKQIYLVDLDSSLSLEQLSDLEKPLQIMRDAASFLFNLAVSLTNPKYIKIFAINELKYINPFRSFLYGYFSEIDRNILDIAAEIIFKYFVDTYFESHSKLTEFIKNHQAKINNPPSFQDWIYFSNFGEMWLNREETFSVMITIIWKLFYLSDLGSKYPVRLDEKTFFNNIGNYASQNFVNDLSSLVHQRFNHIS